MVMTGLLLLMSRQLTWSDPAFLGDAVQQQRHVIPTSVVAAETVQVPVKVRHGMVLDGRRRLLLLQMMLRITSSTITATIASATGLVRRFFAPSHTVHDD